MNGLDRIREAAARDRSLRFTNLMHHITEEMLREAYYPLKREAERFLKAMKERFAEHGLEIHGEKTRLIEFGRFAETNRAGRVEGKPETFDFLGFTHVCGRTLKGNRFTVRRKTIATRLRAKLKAVRRELIIRRHEPVPELGKWLRSVVQGHLNYFAVPGNGHPYRDCRNYIP